MSPEVDEPKQVDYGASSYTSSFSYRFPLSLQIIFCLLQLVILPFLPESPRWLIARGKTAYAKEVILAICAASSFESSANATAMLADIQRAVEIENDNKPLYQDLFARGSLQYYRRTLLAFGVQAMQQLTGINVIAYYSTVIFKQSVHMSDHLALIMGGCVSIAFLCGTLVATQLIDRVGRRRVGKREIAPYLSPFKALLTPLPQQLMMYGYACTCIGMAITAIGTSKNTFAFGCAATFGLFFFNFNFGVGLQIPPWLYGVEITPLKLRYIAGAIIAASGWIWNYAVVQVTEPGISGIGYRYFIIWSVFNFCWFWVIYCAYSPHSAAIVVFPVHAKKSLRIVLRPVFYPETARKTLEELDFIFMKPEERDLAMGTGVDVALAATKLVDSKRAETVIKHVEEV
ncbi:hypothetical protein H2200_005206 [Cladophialophora chaetospira]|uniref:Major facilitator superfamily (MFS) profile domain-containing protein n=1 Tax=Cladophialophora chaetospira TaxID=386627 RepID=A0AA38XC70_9EURO|nr:hypothetical protein H2200_005206 [Cladophialophora chaetospira]